jgi:hypothetical protein
MDALSLYIFQFIHVTQIIGYSGSSDAHKKYEKKRKFHVFCNVFCWEKHIKTEKH